MTDTDIRSLIAWGCAVLLEALILALQLAAMWRNA